MVLEVSYQLEPGRTGGGPLRTLLRSPTLLGHPGVVPTLWEVSLPSAWVPLAPEAGPGVERTWGRRGWLLAPHLAVTDANLERWFTGSAAEDGTPATHPSLVCWRDGSADLAVTHVPQQVWLLVCSLGLLAVGLFLSWLTWPADPRSLAEPRTRGRLVLPVLALAAVAVIAGVLLWPTALAYVAYGCQPGAAVLLAVAGLQWLLHERYRRQVVFLPSFSRGRTEPPSGRTGSSRPREVPPEQPESRAGRTPGEPSTVDAPRPAGSSASSPRMKEEG
jgi:hypothetical protein